MISQKFKKNSTRNLLKGTQKFQRSMCLRGRSMGDIDGQEENYGNEYQTRKKSTHTNFGRIMEGEVRNLRTFTGSAETFKEQKD